MSARKKIAILGGGPAGLSTAYFITSQPGWEERYEITVHQMGWRLGGKCASGRNAEAGRRIEEHGIHIFANFYSNIFGMTKACYDELDWGPDEPVTTMDEAFGSSNFQLMMDYVDGRWTKNKAWLPHNDEVPWEGESYLPSPEALIEEVLGFLYSILTGEDAPDDVPEAEPEGRLGRWLHKAEEALVGFVGHEAEKKLLAALRRARAERAVPTRATHGWLVDGIDEVLKLLLEAVEEAVRGVEHALDFFKKAVQRLVGLADEILSDAERIRWIAQQFEYYWTLLKGVIVDDLFLVGVGTIDGENYRGWLTRHGISEATLNACMPQAIPNICFLYPDGDSNRMPVISAAGYVMFGLRQFLAKGQALYFFAAGTGDTIIGPLYRVLRNRGVKFEFFHKVENLGVADGAIDTVDVRVQAEVRREVAAAGGYDPLVTVKGMKCWPSEPDWSRLKGGARMKAQGVDFESYWSKPTGSVRTLRRGKDFDYVVLALSIGAFRAVCPELLEADASWAEMVEQLKTVQTQQVQIWLKDSTDALGWGELGLTGTDRVGGPTYNYPLTDFVDYTDVLKWEEWPEDNRPAGLVYFCGPLQEPAEVPDFSDTDYPKRQKERVGWMAAQYLRDLGPLLSKAVSSRPIDPRGLDYEKLVCWRDDAETRGEYRVLQQFNRANIDPTERYVMANPGTAKYRKKAWESGFSNLAIAGDWIWTGMNLGAIEAACMSGALASLALTGAPSTDRIAGYTFLHPGDGEGPAEPIIPTE